MLSLQKLTNEIHYAFRERWIMLDYTALKAAVKGWKLFVSDLERIQNDLDFKKYWSEAKGIEKRITSRTFAFGLHFLFEFLDGLKKFSIIGQQSAGILIRKEAFRIDVVNLAEQYKENNGPNVIQLLLDASCQN